MSKLTNLIDYDTFYYEFSHFSIKDDDWCGTQIQTSEQVSKYNKTTQSHLNFVQVFDTYSYLKKLYVVMATAVQVYLQHKFSFYNIAFK